MARKTKQQYDITARDRTKEAYRSVRRNARSTSSAVAKSFALITGAVGIGQLTKQISQSGLQMEKFNRVLKNVTGSQVAADREFKFITDTAKRLGLELSKTGNQYIALAAASKGTALEGKETRDIFLAVSEASTVLGLSTDQTAGALTAIQQMMSKGTVQAEELRGQLGERLPGAFQIASRAMGVTTKELGKLLEQGKVTAEDMLPKLAAELRSTFGGSVDEAADSTVASFGRLKTSIFELTAAIADKFGLNAALREGSNAAAGFATSVANSVNDKDFSERIDETRDSLQRLRAELEVTTRVQAKMAARDGEYALVIGRDPKKIKQEIFQAEKDLREFVRRGTEILTGGDGTSTKDKSSERIRLALEQFKKSSAELDAIIDKREAAAERIAGISEITVPQELLDRNVAIEKSAKAWEVYAQAFEDTRTPTEALALGLERLERTRTQLIASGIEEARVNDVIKRQAEDLREAYDETSEAIKRRNIELQFVFKSGIFAAFDDGVEGMVKAWARGLQQMLAEAAASNLMTLLGIGKSGDGNKKGAGGFFSTLFGFKDGGSFQVGGGGGIDSQLVAFKASPNERVTVTKPGQSSGGGFSFTQNLTIDARGADEARIMRVLPAMLERSREQTKAEIMQQRARGRF